MPPPWAFLSSNHVAAGNPWFRAVAAGNQVAAAPWFGAVAAGNQIAAAPWFGAAKNQVGAAPWFGAAVNIVKDPLFSLVQAAKDLLSQQHPCSHQTG